MPGRRVASPCVPLARAGGRLFLFGLLVLAGCNDESEADPSGLDTAGDAAAGDTPSPDDGAETADPEEDDADTDKLSPPDEPEPSIDLTGPVDEIERIYREQHAYRTWLFRHPDPGNTERLARITHRDCPCWKSDHELLTRYARHRHWWVGPDSQILHIELVDQPTDNLLRLHVTWERERPAQLIDEAGDVHSELPAARGVKEILMRRGALDPHRPHRDLSGHPWKVIIADRLQYEELAGGG